MKLAAKALAVWVVIMILEVGNGLLRKVLVEPLVGDLPARQIGVAIGSLMIVLVTYLSARWLRSRRRLPLLLVGILWMALTVLFEVVLGRAVMGLSWARIWSDYDLAAGGLMPLGLLAMALSPLLGTWLWRQTRVRKRRRRKAHRLRKDTAARRPIAGTTAGISSGLAVRGAPPAAGSGSPRGGRKDDRHGG